MCSTTLTLRRVKKMINVDNTKPEDYMNDQEPDQASYTKVVMASDEFKKDQKAVYDKYMNNPNNFCEGEADPKEDTPEQMNNWLRQGGW
jgi:hypothetical protein